MNEYDSKKEEIRKFLESFEHRKNRTIVIVDYGNVEKWKNSLGWKIDIKKLSQLVRYFSIGSEFLRRFYYGADFGPNDHSDILSEWSRSIFERARMNRFEVVKKRVKYIHSKDNPAGYEKKCDLDVEMAVDLIRERENYDTVVLFSGDGDLMCVVKYLKEEYNKKCVVFAARGHIGREVIDAFNEGFVEEILYADDFEYRLNKSQF
ncbi:MAG: NYN domain-containing protein [Patescibacteria group bacterium]